MNATYYLVRKEWIYLIHSLKRLWIATIIISLLLPLGQIYFIFTVPVITAYMLTFGIASYEEKSEVQLFNLMLPVSRNNICMAKYIASIGYSIIGGLVGVGGLLLNKLIMHLATSDIPGIFEWFILTVFITMIYNSFVLPLILCKGIMKTRYIIFGAYFVSFAVLGGCKESIMQIFRSMNQNSGGYLMVTFMLSLILYVLSYLCCTYFYKRKDF